MEEPHCVKEEVKQFFETRFKEQGGCRPKLDGVHFKFISLEDNVFLLAKFEEGEVKEAV